MFLRRRSLRRIGRDRAAAPHSRGAVALRASAANSAAFLPLFVRPARRRLTTLRHMKIPTLGRWWPQREQARSGAWVALRVAPGEAGEPSRFDFVRVDPAGPAARPRLSRQGGGSLQELAVWQAGGAFRGAKLVLMLEAGQRQMLMLDLPAVPEAEQADALRWPVAEALDASAEDLLFDATPLPALNEGGKRQALVAASANHQVQPLLGLLAQAGLRPDAIDVVDMAQRNAVLLQTPANARAAQVVLGLSGGELLVALVAAGELCVARNLPLALPASMNDDEALRERIVLHVQRTLDLLERQITRFAIGGAFAVAGDFTPQALDALRQVLPGGLTEINLGSVVAQDGTALRTALPVTTRLAALAALRCAQARPRVSETADETAEVSA